MKSYVIGESYSPRNLFALCSDFKQSMARALMLSLLAFWLLGTGDISACPGMLSSMSAYPHAIEVLPAGNENVDEFSIVVSMGTENSPFSGWLGQILEFDLESSLDADAVISLDIANSWLGTDGGSNASWTLLPNRRTLLLEFSRQGCDAVSGSGEIVKIVIENGGISPPMALSPGRDEVVIEDVLKIRPLLPQPDDSMQVIVSPSVFSGFMNIESVGMKMSEATLYSTSGTLYRIEPAETMGANHVRIDTRHFPPGIYFLRLKLQSGEIVTKKILKVR